MQAMEFLLDLITHQYVCVLKASILAGQYAPSVDWVNFTSVK